MCGIAFSIKRVNNSSGCAKVQFVNHLTSFDPKIIDYNKRRGPDSNVLYSLACNNILIEGQSTVLNTRGLWSESSDFENHPLEKTHWQQPFHALGSSNLLAFNGELWSGLPKIDQINVNDGEVLFNALNGLTEPSSETIAAILMKLCGPFAFVFYHHLTQSVYFARDRLGRRSLLTNLKSDSVLKDLPLGGIKLESLMISSISGIDANSSTECIYEVACGYLFKFDLTDFRLYAHSFATEFEQKYLTINKTVDFTSQINLIELEETFIDLLKLNLSHRIYSIPKRDTERRALGILFSGGVDCSVLSVLSHVVAPSDCIIDLINVSFLEPRQSKNFPDLSPDEHFSRCPDRISAIESFEQIKALYPGNWNLILVNVMPEELDAHRSEILDLMMPYNTQMDFSLATAFFFASRGKGYLYTNSTNNLNTARNGGSYTSTSRVLVSGLGADEQLGGYGRHLTAFNARSWEGLIDELEKDIMRLDVRQLGRDDRIISHHSREIHYPYLDEKVMQFLSGLPVNVKSNFEQPSDNKTLKSKTLLRQVALKLHLSKAAYYPKRAIQFGSRSAMRESGNANKVKGSDFIYN